MSRLNISDSMPASARFVIEELNNLPQESILLLISSLTLAALSLLWLQVRSKARARQKAKDEAQLATLISQSQAQTLLLEQYQERLKTLESYVDLVNDKQQQLLSNGSARKHRLQDAIDFAGRGLDARELARRAGVNGSEARLIGELYGVNAA